MKKAQKVINTTTKSANSPKGKESGTTWFQQKDGRRIRVTFTDAVKPLVLQCLPEDIEGAVCGNPFNCVMARMFLRTLGALCTEVRVGKKYMHVVKGNTSTRFAVKGKLKKAIHLFDISKGREGFKVGEKYTILPPAPTDKRNGRVKAPFGPKNGKGEVRMMKERVAPVRTAPTRDLTCYLGDRDAG